MINATGPSGVPITPGQPSIGAAPIPVANTPNVIAPSPTAPSITTSGSLKPPTKKLPIKLIIGGIVLALLLIGGIAAFLLSQTSQDVRQQASANPYSIGVCCINNTTTPGLTPSECSAIPGATVGVCGSTTTPTTAPAGKCGPGAPKYDAATKKCGPFYKK
jgi:hypothetical protein